MGDDEVFCEDHQEICAEDHISDRSILTDTLCPIGVPKIQQNSSLTNSRVFPQFGSPGVDHNLESVYQTHKKIEKVDAELDTSNQV